MKRLKRFALPLVLSTALHIGAGVGIGKIIEYLKPPPVAEKVLHENIQKPPEMKKKPDLEKLKGERHQYVSELHESLMKGEEIKLSDFLIKSGTLDRDIELAEKGEFGISEEARKAVYRKIVADANDAVYYEEDKISALHQFVHTEVAKGYFYASGDITNVLDRGWYNCLSSTQLYSALLEDSLGIKDYQILLFDDHVATSYKGRKIENVEHEWEKTNKRYNGCGLPVHKDAFIAAYLVRNGVQPEELPPYLSEIYLAEKKNWKGCPKKGKKIVANLLNDSGFPMPGVKSGLSVPSYFMPNPHYKTTTEDIVKMAKGIYAANRYTHRHDEKEFVEVDVNGNKMMINPILIPEETDWGDLLERYKFYFSLASLTPFLSKEESCTYPILAIPPSTPIEIIDGFLALDDSRFEAHSEENICDRYKKIIETGTTEELKEYLAYNFCKDINYLLKEKYLDKKDWYILRFGLADLMISENFDFFLTELTSKNKKIKAEAAVGMILSDREEACKILSELPEEERKPIEFQIVWGCDDVETAWEYIMQWPEGSKPKNNVMLFSSLQLIKGKEITQEQYDFLIKIKDIPGFEYGSEIARIAYERGDKKLAEEYLQKIVDRILNGEDLTIACCLPIELIPLLVPLLEKPEHATNMARHIICSGKEEEFAEELTDSLRRIVRDTSRYEYDRVLAAYFLLKMGVNPLKE